MQDAYEELVRWYLRFNGFLCIENFVIHEPAPDADVVPQGGEIDTLAVRFPFSHEVTHAAPQKQMIRDERLNAEKESVIDFVIAEVKSGDRIRLNSIWRRANPEQDKARIEYMLRWLGPFRDQATIELVAEKLRTEVRAHHANYSVRLILFAKRDAPQGLPEGITVITFEQIMRFIVESRANCWIQLGVGTRSRHPQWSELVNMLWAVAGPERRLKPAEKIAAMLEVLDQTNFQRQKESEMRLLLSNLLTSPAYSFDDNIRSVLPDEQGLYIIYDWAVSSPVVIRAGRTKSASGGLKQRVYSNHLMGDQKGNLRQQLVADHVCADCEAAKNWIRSRCKVRFIPVPDDGIRCWAEHYMLSILRPKYCD
jgi:hypothetical protein